MSTLPELPPSLNFLVCNNNQIANLPNLPTALFLLQCNNNQIQSLPSLPVSLSILRVSYNKLVQLPSISSAVTQLTADNNCFSSTPINPYPSTLTFFQVTPNRPDCASILPSEISLSQSSNNILSQETYNFGDTFIAASSGSITFTITNSGLGNLTLSGTPKIKILGNNASDFTINESSTVATVSAGGSTTFSINFTPSEACLREATISITNNDTDENPFILNLSGTGVHLPNIISGANYVCNSQTYYYTISDPLAGSTYTWSVPSDYTITSGQGTSAIALAAGASSGNILVIETTANGCTALNASFVVSSNSAPTVPTISGITNVCPNQTGVAYSIPASSGATYAWIIPGGGIATPISSNATTVNFGANVSTVEVMVINTCGNAFASLQLSSNSPYEIGSIDYSCAGTTPICVPFKSVSTLSNGIIGLDFVLNYDATKLTPTGTATLGSVATTYATYSLNIGTPGKVYGTIYLNGAPSNTYISGLGDIICVNFNLASGATPFNTTITSESVEESMPLSSKTVCAATPGTFTYSRPLNAQLYYRNSTATTKRITGVVGNTTTSFTGTDAACNSTGTTVSGISTTGLFSYDVTNSSSLKIERDILGDLSVPALSCANIQSVISSTDRNMAAQISNLTITSPTVYELISADVNLDGKVTAGDAALISQRTINANNCEFPQVSNYVFDGTNLVPSPTYTKSKDWVFIDQATLNNPLFTAGMSKNKVPVAPECLGASVISPACTTAADVVYQGILLGDVNGSWVSSNSANAKIGSTNELIIDLSKALSLGDNMFSIPVSYVSDEVFYGIDMEVDYAESLISLESVSKNSLFGAVGFDWNDVANAKLLVTTFAEAGLVTNQPLLYLQVKSATGTLSTADLGAITAYFNEKPASTRILAPILNTIENSLFENVSVYPNPTSTVLMINGLETAYQTKIYNLLGVEVATLNGSPKEINVSTLSAGVYYLKVISDSKEKLIRFTKVN